MPEVASLAVKPAVCVPRHQPLTPGTEQLSAAAFSTTPGTEAADLASYKLSTYTYIYQSVYGSPEVDGTTPTITKDAVAADGKSVRLTVDKVQEGHVHELHLDGIKSAQGQPLLHPTAYYTLNYIPDTP